MSIEKEHADKMDKINKFYNLGRNKFKRLNDEISAQQMSEHLTEDDVSGMSLEQKILYGYYSVNPVAPKARKNSMQEDPEYK